MKNLNNALRSLRLNRCEYASMNVLDVICYCASHDFDNLSRTEYLMCYDTVVNHKVNKVKFA